MDTFELTFAASLREAAAAAGRAPMPVAAKPRRAPHVGSTLAAAAAVAGIVTGAVVLGPRALEERRDPSPSEISPAEPGGTTPTGRSTGQRDAVTAQVEDLAAYSDIAGFGKVAADYDSATVTIYWKGAPPAAVAATTGTTPQGVRVILAEADYSQAELTSAGTRVMDHAREVFGPGVVTAVVPNRDLSGLVVEATSSLDLSQLSGLEAVPLALKLVAGDGAVLAD